MVSVTPTSSSATAYVLHVRRALLMANYELGLYQGLF